MKKFIYDFGYFYSQKDSGTIRIEMEEELDEFDLDDCIEKAYKSGKLPEEYVENIIYVEEIEDDDMK